MKLTKILFLSLYLSSVLTTLMFFYFFYYMLAPINVLLVDDIETYFKEKNFLDKYFYMSVLEQPFDVKEPVEAGKYISFTVPFIYNFGEPGVYTPILFCGDDAYSLSRDPIGTAIAPVGELVKPTSNYHLIPEEVKGKYCHLEFHTTYRIPLRESVVKIIETEHFEVL